MASEPYGELEMPIKGPPTPHGGAMYAAELQRGRLLSATFEVVGELGYEGLSARRVSERVGVSNRTFYEVFSDREDCFLAAFNHAVDGLELEMRAGWESELGWTARVRGALTALLQAEGVVGATFGVIHAYHASFRSEQGSGNGEFSEPTGVAVNEVTSGVLGR